MPETAPAPRSRPGLMASGAQRRPQRPCVAAISAAKAQIVIPTPDPYQHRVGEAEGGKADRQAGDAAQRQAQQQHRSHRAAQSRNHDDRQRRRDDDDELDRLRRLDEQQIERRREDGKAEPAHRIEQRRDKSRGRQAKPVGETHQSRPCDAACDLRAYTPFGEKAGPNPEGECMHATLTLVDLAGAIALLIWGVHMVQTGVTRAFGPRLRRILNQALGNRGKAFLAGLGVTAILQSSTATGLMVSSFAAGGFVDLVPALAVMLGANVGTTLIVQVLSFDVSPVSYLLILLGVLMFRRSTVTCTRDLGRVGIGLGLMLLALQHLLAMITPYEDVPSLRMLLGAITTEPLIDVLLAAGLTWAAHSSVAVVLLIMTFAVQGDRAAACRLCAGARSQSRHRHQSAARERRERRPCRQAAAGRQSAQPASSAARWFSRCSTGSARPSLRSTPIPAGPSPIFTPASTSSWRCCSSRC